MLLNEEILNMMFRNINLIVRSTVFSMQPSAIQYGSVDATNAANGQIPSSERSVTPLLQDFMDPSMCFVPNGYPSTAYYYGGRLICAILCYEIDLMVEGLNFSCIKFS